MEDQKRSGVLASVSLAQFILESGYGKSELAQKANNCFGMKKILSGNNWSGSVWDGVSSYIKETKEQRADGSIISMKVDFRKYGCLEDSIADHSAYLTGAMNGNKLRYGGLKGCTDYRQAVQIIKDGGYATSHTYVEKLCGIIEKWNLTRFDVKGFISYKVKVDIENLNIRKGPGTDTERVAYIPKGIYTILEEADGVGASKWGRLKSDLGWISLDYVGRA